MKNDYPEPLPWIRPCYPSLNRTAFCVPSEYELTRFYCRGLLLLTLTGFFSLLQSQIELCIFIIKTLVIECLSEWYILIRFFPAYTQCIYTLSQEINANF